MSDLSSFSMLDLFRLEVETQLSSFTEALLALESSAEPAPLLEQLMRSCHSLKGAARLVGVSPAERLAHVMEDCFVAAQGGQLAIGQGAVDVLLRAGDQIRVLAQLGDAELARWEAEHADLLEAHVQALEAVRSGSPIAPLEPAAADSPSEEPEPPAEAQQRERTLRLAADRLDNLLSLAGEATVTVGWLQQHMAALVRLKQMSSDLLRKLGSIESAGLDPRGQAGLEGAQRVASRLASDLLERIEGLANHDRRMTRLARQLHGEVVASRMRPFADAVGGFKRLVRDLSRTLDKAVELQLEGLSVQVDRDILERLEAPLTHLVRNAVDHGIESASEREGAGKSPAGTLRIEAFHRGGMLHLVVEDDGRGLDLDALRARLVARGMVGSDIVDCLREEELVQFLFLPGFSSRATVNEISGRGVGLDVVRSTVSEMGGQMVCTPRLGQGMRFQISLPVTLSVVHCLLVEVDGEAYALPLSRLDRVLQVDPEEIREVEGRPYLPAHQCALASARRVLARGNPEPFTGRLNLVAFATPRGRYGFVVDRLIGKEKLVVQRLDARLGKIPNVSAGAIMDNGEAALILDVDDLVRSLERTFETSRGELVRSAVEDGARKRVLVVDDSITVREVERNLLELMGYQVDVAVDGMDGWNAVRAKEYHLVISDIDMPRMDGIELVNLIKSDAGLRSIPVIVVSYKDREEDRRRGLEAGADYFLTKGSFQDETFNQAVLDLIG